MSGAGDKKPGRKAKSAYRAVIPSDLANVEGVCLAAREFLESNGLADRVFAVDLLLREFVNNAIVHGNGSDASKLVCVEMRVGYKAIALSVTDEGQGFDWRYRRRCISGSSDTSGRGLEIGRLYADRMTFNRAGNRVVLVVGKK
jgi:anti-sigma regulatory factor (Ser/Thr protein kinase)